MKTMKELAAEKSMKRILKNIIKLEKELKLFLKNSQKEFDEIETKYDTVGPFHVPIGGFLKSENA